MPPGRRRPCGRPSRPARPAGLALAALEALADPVAVLDGDARLLLANAAFRRLGAATALDPAALIAAGDGLPVEVRVQRAGGEPSRALASVTPCGPNRWLLRLSDQPAGAHRTAELALLAAQDALTGLSNRRAFTAALDLALERARVQDAPLALALLDLDHFKRVNDTHGHPVGDQVLVEAARRLAGALRPGDVLARVGGEEFAWILPGAGVGEAIAAADRARAVLSGGPLAEGVRMTASVGVCTADRAEDRDTLYARADQSLYWAKSHGRDLTLSWTPTAAAAFGAATDDHAGPHGFDRLLDAARRVDAELGDDTHADRVADLATALAAQLDWDPQRQARLHRAARVHDAGKVALPPELLRRPRALTPSQRAHVRQHAGIGAAMAAPVLGPEPAAWVRHHYERWDGTGYPGRLAADELPDGAQLLGLADAFAAMVGPRPYARPMAVEDALAEVDRCAGGHFRPDAGDLLRGALRWLAPQPA